MLYAFRSENVLWGFGRGLLEVAGVVGDVENGKMVIAAIMDGAGKSICRSQWQW